MQSIRNIAAGLTSITLALVYLSGCPSLTPPPTVPIDTPGGPAPEVPTKRPTPPTLVGPLTDVPAGPVTLAWAPVAGAEAYAAPRRRSRPAARPKRCHYMSFTFNEATRADLLLEGRDG